ncbi:MAG: trehalose-phosphatase [Pseudomonadota bacterium]
MMGPVPPLGTDNCLFLDLDGTLLALRDDPTMIRADAALLALLGDCSARAGGALAIISGRPIRDIDACFEPLRFAAAGIHGLERRDANGVVMTQPVDATRLHEVARQLRKELEDMPMSLLEDKGASLALHWRRAPQDAPALRRLATHMLQQLGSAFRLLEGNCVVELLPRTANKGAAVRAFLNESPFKGRKPVFVGDDLTDLPGFTAAREAGGHGIAVGSRVVAQYALSDVEAVRSWLGSRHD